MTTRFTAVARSVSRISWTRPRPMATHRVGPIVAGSLIAGLVAAVALTLGLFAGKEEPVVSGVVLLAFAGSWAAIALLSTRWTDQPQRWAIAPAICMAVLGVGLIGLAPTSETLDRLGWVWPPVLVAGVVWMVTRARRHLHSHARRWILYPVFGALVLAALGGGFETVRESLDRAAYPMPGQLVDVGGHRLYLNCIGTGSPTVILESGFGANAPSWAWIAPDVARDTRVCVYDPAGLGWSEPAASPQDGVAVANDLHTLLDRAHEPGPYVLVGHSLGGALALNFVARYPNDVAGVVLLDSMHPEQYTRLPGFPTFYEGYRRVSALFPSLTRLGIGRLAFQFEFGDLPADARAEERANSSTAGVVRAQHDEWSMMRTTLIEAQAVTTLGDRPLMVVTAERDMQNGWMPLQDDLATMSTNSTHLVIPDATHAALLEDEAIAAKSSQAIRDLVMVARQTE
jgi:pimeloyl-ACP methyl ester carboxylesterase